MRRIPVGAEQMDIFTDHNRPYVRDLFIVGDNRLPVIEHEHPIMRKPFVSWDGEGYTDDYGKHHYWLLANSIGDRIIAPVGRSFLRRSLCMTRGPTFSAHSSRRWTHISGKNGPGLQPMNAHSSSHLKRIGRTSTGNTMQISSNTMTMNCG